MNYSLSWDSSFLEPVVTIGLTLFGLVGYWVTITNSSLKSIFIKALGEERGGVEWIMFWRYAGVFYFALVPAIVLFSLFPHNLSFYGVSLVNLPESLLWILGFSLIIVLMQSKSARQPENVDQYPQIRLNDWTGGLIIKNSFGWFIYLLAYEFLYRGILLFGLIDAFGIWPAIMVNTIIYSLAHIPKGNREALAAIPFGIILCYLTIRTETIWIAVFVHLALALSNDYFALAESKTMRFVRKA
jgi:membrane protease YdiL (CAAX protease family)